MAPPTMSRYSPRADISDSLIPAERGYALRPWHQSDATLVLEAFAPEDMAHLGAWPMRTKDDAARWIASWTHRQVQGKGYALAVQSPNGMVVGNVAVGSVDREHSTGWVTYWTAPSARNRGVATIGLRALAAWAHTALDLYRLELGHQVSNPAACAVARHAGFLVEGLQRAKIRHGGVRYDVELHARLATDVVPEL